MGDPFQQVHDWEPGILASGLFWTIPISPSTIIVNQNTGAATLRVNNLAMPDYGNFFNAISPTPDPPPVPSHVSFEVSWPGRGVVTQIDDESRLTDMQRSVTSAESHFESAIQAWPNTLWTGRRCSDVWRRRTLE